MLYHPEFIVYLWLLPVALFVIIPAGLATCRLVMTAVKQSPEEKESFGIEPELLAKA